jgi:N-acetylmuramoyl-L-alanine amidase
VEVRPNGAFLAFVPVPRDSVYHLRATRGVETVQLDVPVSLPPAPPAPADTPQILPGSVTPTGAWTAAPGERIEVGFRGTRGGEAWLALPGGARVPLVEARGVEGGASDFEVSPGAGAADGDSPWSAYRGFLNARRILARDTTVAWPRLASGPRPTLVRSAGSAQRAAAGATSAIGGSASPERIRRAIEEAPEGAGAAVVLVVSGDTTVRPLPLNLVLADPDRPRAGTGWDPGEPEDNGDRHIIARPGPGGGPYHYTWRNGVELELTGERNGIYRVRLTDDLSAWTPAGDVRLAPPGTLPPASRVSTVRLDPQPGYVDVHVALDRPLPYAVEEGDSVLSLLVYGATSRVNFLQHGRVDPYIARGEWSQPSDRLFRLDLHLTDRTWGYEAFWGEGDDLVLRLKRPPAIDPDHPLAGLTVGVDAGHGGADRRTWGPTGLAEADANLGVALALRDLLEERGARVVMTRTADSTLSLVERTELARDQDVDLWVSVHNNAFPDGVNPWENNGTSVYFNHPRAAGLAWSVQRALLDELGLRDLGVGRADLHQARFTWAPAILTETMFMMIPEQEAFLRSADGQRRIAEAHFRGIVEWLRSR